MGIPDRHGRDHARRRRLQLGRRDGGPHYSPAGTPPPARRVVMVRAGTLTGLVTALVLAGTWMVSAASAPAAAAHPGYTAAILVYVLACAWVAVLAVLREHPRQALVVWLAAAGMLGLFPCLIAAIVLVARRPRPARGPWGASVTAGQGDHGASVAQLPGRGGSEPEATQADYARLALLEIEAALAITNRAGLGLGYPVPPWVDGTLDHLLEAKDAIEHLTGAAGPDPAA